jgi:hypothetical protein
MQMKRVINGMTFNTDTSTLLARASWTLPDTYSPHFGSECDGELYQTRGGAFFVITTIHTKDSDGDPVDKVECEPMSTERANAWMNGDVEIIRNRFEEPPEAEAESEPGSTIYVRVPIALKRDVDAAAKEAKLSGNAWTMRCIESCLEFPRQLVEIWSIAKGLSAPWSSDTIGKDRDLDQYKLKLATKALDDIGDLVITFAEERFGTNDLSKISGAERVLMEPSFGRRYQPYPE